MTALACVVGVVVVAVVVVAAAPSPRAVDVAAFVALAGSLGGSLACLPYLVAFYFGG